MDRIGHEPPRSSEQPRGLWKTLRMAKAADSNESMNPASPDKQSGQQPPSGAPCSPVCLSLSPHGPSPPHPDREPQNPRISQAPKSQDFFPKTPHRLHYGYRT